MINGLNSVFWRGCMVKPKNEIKGSLLILKVIQVK